MKKTKIDWADSTWNPVTGCLHDCEYCYARGIAKRFEGLIELPFYEDVDPKSYYGYEYNPENNLYDIFRQQERRTKKGEIVKAAYPFGFIPTLHRYRLDEPAREKKPQTVFVGSMCDLFGDWVPDGWIEKVFAACAAAPQHRYLFLTKNPKRYEKFYRRMPSNMWFGAMVGYSGGKDSTVLAQLFREAGVKHFFIHNVTGIDPPELVYFKRRMFSRWRNEGIICEDIPYSKSIIEICRQKKNPPTRKMRFCCEVLKEGRKPGLEDCVCSFGARKHESASRAARRDELEIEKTKKNVKLFAFDDSQNRRQFETCYASGFREIRVNPIAYWTDDDVWDFIRDRKLPYCELYDEGFHRLGCVGCPMAGAQRKAGFDRWPGLRRVWERAFMAIWEAREDAGMGWWRGIESVSDLWDWWMEDLPKLEEAIEGQLEMEGFG